MAQLYADEDVPFPRCGTVCASLGTMLYVLDQSSVRMSGRASKSRSVVRMVSFICRAREATMISIWDKTRPFRRSSV